MDYPAYYITYITTTARNTVLVEQSRPYEKLERIKNHLRNTGFIYDDDLHSYVNIESMELARVYLEACRDAPSVKRKLVKIGGHKQSIVKVTVNL